MRVPGRSIVLLLPLLVSCGGDLRPSIAGSSLLIVTLDTTRRDVLGFAKGGTMEPARTPVLDDLARHSVEFTHAWTVAPLTLPAHASLFCGVYPCVHGVRDNLGFRLPEQARTLAERFAERGFATGAVVAAPVVGPESGIGQGFELFDGPTRESGIEERPAGVVTNAAIAMLARLAATTKPFVLWVHYFDAHAPHGAKADERAGYRGEVERIDRQVARLLEAAHAAAARRPLCVVVVADHGEALGDDGEATHGHLLHDATLRIPLLIHHPSIVTGRCDATVSLVDLLPTLVDAFELPAAGAMQGRSLLQELVDEEARSSTEARTIFLESRLPWHEFGWPWLDGACDGRFLWVDRPTPRLFDLEADRGEGRDASAAAPERVAKLTAALQAFQAKCRDLPASGVAAHADGALTQLGYVAARREAPQDKSTLAEPGDRFALVELRDRGIEELAAGHVDVAIALFERLRLENPDPAPGSLLIAVARSRSAEGLADGPERRAALERAEAAWRAAIVDCPADANRRLNRAYTLLDLGRRADAILELEQCLSLAPDDAAARAALEEARSERPPAAKEEGGARR